ncbi:MAG: hypothetical protein IAE81_06050 [Caldilineaceae bacterium]|nr:hypothetical protein [Caldilineaceae bacterium]
MSEFMHPETPIRNLPPENWEHYPLYKDVREAVASLPIYFRTETHISGVMATDLHTLNTVLGASIEDQVVRTLNLLRNAWDQAGKYSLFSFVRQAQTFPDVLLRRASTNEVLLGIELKGWYLLAKEREPSLRFQATADACAVQDMIVVVPWALSNVISGSPLLFEPFIESANYAAHFRNYHWQYVRQTKNATGIDIPRNIRPYPSKSDQIHDKPEADGGGNFGRLARTGIMDEYMQKLEDVELCGIKTTYWREFLKAFQESTTDIEAHGALDRLRKKVQASADLPSPRAHSTLLILAELERLLDLSE